MSFSTTGRWQVEVASCLQRFTVGLILLALVGMLCGLLSGCASTDAARHRARAAVAFNLAHARDHRLPPIARAIAAANWNGWTIQDFLLGGPRPPQEVIDQLSPEVRAELGLDGGE